MIQVTSPGRINIIGEHTDYNDGFVLPAAIDKTTSFQIKKNGTDAICNIQADNVNQSYQFNLQNFKPIHSGWENYVMGVVSELQKLDAQLTGFDACFNGDVPIGSGMSSSAALECSLAFALNHLFDLGLEKWQLIKAAQMAEHHFVGIKCGIMDQFASMMGKKNQVMMLDCRSLEFEYFPLELGDYELLLLNSNVTHELANSEYNARREECETGVEILKKYLPQIKNLRDISLNQLTTLEDKLPAQIYRRCHHVVAENERVIAATKALQVGELEQLGQLIYQSHFSLQNDYSVTCKETDFLVQQTIDNPHILGSRQMGGGFGGCTLNLIKKGQKESFISATQALYQQRFGLSLTPYSVTIEDGTKVITNH